jgi:hypothetical protein
MYLNKLVGRTDIENALARLDKPTQDEVRMMAAQVLKTAHGVGDRVAAVDDMLRGVSSQMQAVDEKVNMVHDSVRAQLGFNSHLSCGSLSQALKSRSSPAECSWVLTLIYHGLGCQCDNPNS